MSDGRRSKVVHSNRLQHQIQVMANSSESTATESVLYPWPTQKVEHFIEEIVNQPSRYPTATTVLQH